MNNLDAIADRADMIVNGYAFTKEADGIRVLNLEAPHNASVLSEDGDVIETNMNDIELALIGRYYARNRQFLLASSEEAAYA
ncbi:MAG: hypothetical protein IJ741_08520 [Schwartzia sp.]|nr:hypothetical protein [Schwartzia sp. (in: firmicutes)]